MHPRTLELLNYLDTSRATLQSAFGAVQPVLRTYPPAPGRWSAAAVVEHVAIVERRVSKLLETQIAAAQAEGRAQRERDATPILPTIGLNRVLDRTNPVTAPDVAQPTGLDAETAWAALEQAGAAVRHALESADGLALGAITAPHPLFGPLTFYEWFAFLGAHEARHACQIREDYADDRVTNRSGAV